VLQRVRLVNAGVTLFNELTVNVKDGETKIVILTKEGDHPAFEWEFRRDFKKEG